MYMYQNVFILLVVMSSPFFLRVKSLEVKSVYEEEKYLLLKKT